MMLSTTCDANGILDVSRPGSNDWGPAFVLLTLGVWILGLGVGFRVAMTILASVGMAAAVIGLFRPAIGAIGVSMVCTLDVLIRVYMAEDGFLRWNTLNYWLIGVTAVAAPCVLRRNDLQTRLLQVFLVVLLIGIHHSPSRMEGIQHIVNLFVMFGLLVYFVRAGRRDEVFFWLGLVNGVLAGAGGLLFYLQKDSLPYINPNAWSYFPLTAIFSICLASMVVGPRDRRARLLDMLAIVNLCWVLLSGSRGAILVALICGLFLLTRVRSPVRRLGILAAAALMAVAILASFSDMRDQAVDRIDKLFDSRRTYADRTSGRSELIRGGWRIFLDHPLGVGTGGFAVTWAALDSREGMSSWGAGHTKPAHCGWVKTLAENGIPGIVLHALFVLSFAFVGWQQRARDPARIGLMVTTVLALAFLSTEFQSKGLWLLAAGGMTLLGREKA